MFDHSRQSLQQALISSFWNLNLFYSSSLLRIQSYIFSPVSSLWTIEWNSEDSGFIYCKLCNSRRYLKVVNLLNTKLTFITVAYRLFGIISEWILFSFVKCSILQLNIDSGQYLVGGFHCFLSLFWSYHDDALDTSRRNSGSFIVYSQPLSFRNPKLRMLAIDLNQVFGVENLVFVQNSSQQFDWLR